jgi:hypothetical protein
MRRATREGALPTYAGITTEKRGGAALMQRRPVAHPRSDLRVTVRNQHRPHEPAGPKRVLDFLPGRTKIEQEELGVDEPLLHPTIADSSVRLKARHWRQSGKSEPRAPPRPPPRTVGGLKAAADVFNAAISAPGTPASAIGGMSGADGERVVVDTPSARTLPPWMSGSAGTGSENNTGTWPATTSVKAGALPVEHCSTACP